MMLMNNRKRTKSRYIKKQLRYLENFFIKGLANIPDNFIIRSEVDGIDNDKDEMTVRVTIYPK